MENIFGFRSIRWRIAFPYLLLILASFTALGIILTANLRQNEIESLESRLLAEARMVAEAAAPALETGENPLELDRQVGRWSQILGSRITVIDPGGVVLADSHADRAQMDNHLDRPEVVDARQSGEGSSLRFSRTLGREMLYSAVRVNGAGGSRGYVRASLPLAEIRERERTLQRTILATSLTAAAVSIVLAVLIAERTTLPIRRLTESVQTLAAGNLSVRLTPTTRDEVGALTRSINLMADRLRDQFSYLDDERVKLSAVLHQMTDGVLMVDRSGRIQLMNASAEHLFGIRENEALGRSLVDVVRIHQIVDVWERSMETRRESTASYEFSQTNQFLEFVAIPFEDALEGSVLLIVRDLTDIRRLETIRRDFISNISHELRTPLASLKALVETLLEGAIEDRGAALHFLSRMDEEVDSLTQIVQELLELSRIESGRVPLEIVSVPAGKLIDNALERLSLQADRAGLSVEVHAPDQVPEVRADPARIEQVLVNLLHNAIKFTPEGGRIDLSTYLEGEMVVFRIDDTGVGIPPDELPRIFERFYKADRSRSGGGTGLGLAISRHLVEAHGGKIWAESVEGSGSTFYFSLPASAE